MTFDEDIILLAGPTASGKTSLAIQMVQGSDGVVINADSMQVYSELSIISARPTADETAHCPHFLFGHVPAAESYSVARWLVDLAPLITRFHSESRQMVIVGGTGLYFSALLNGISSMPDIPGAIRKKWRSANQQQLHSQLAELDPVAAEGLNPEDTQRLIRALEVFDATGISITEWQRQPGESILPKGASVKKLLLLPSREIVHIRIEKRFDQMIENGALEEVKTLLALGLDKSLPAMKAIGVPQLSNFLAGKLELDEAINLAKIASRQYSKRQNTWFRNSFDEEWRII